MLCQQNLISQHKYVVMTQQKCAISAKMTSQRNELIQQKIRCVSNNLVSYHMSDDDSTKDS